MSQTKILRIAIRPLIKPLPIFAVILLAIAGFFSTVTAGMKKVTIGIYDDKPKMFTDADGNPQGIFVDIINEIAKNAGWNVEYKKSSLEECIQLLDSGKIDILPDVVNSDERAKKYYLNKLQVLPDWINIYKRNGADINFMDDLNKKRIAVVNNSVEQQVFYIKCLQINIKPVIIPLSDYDKAASFVENGKADAVLLSRFYEHSGNHLKNVVPTGLFFHATGDYFATSDYKNKKLLDEIDKQLATLENAVNSPYYKSLEKWLNNNKNPPEDFNLKRITVIESILIMVAVFVIFLLQKKATKLEKELRHRTVLLNNAHLSINKTSCM